MIKDDLESLIKRIPLLSDVSFSEINIQPLTGLTNKNFLISTTDEQYVLRIPRKRTNSNINRSNEAFNQNIVENLGLSPKVLWREVNQDSELTGVCLSVYLEGVQELAVDECNSLNDLESLKRVAKTLKSLHTSGAQFRGVMDGLFVTEILKQYFSLCTRSQQIVLRGEYRKALQLLSEIDDPKYSSHAFVPSHADLVLENILIDHCVRKDSSGNKVSKIWLIDWEYSAMSSPFWDIATLCNATNLSEEKSYAFLKMTLIGSYKEDFETLKQYRYISKTVSACWQAAFKGSF